jgi:hypothetical protein
MGEKEKALTYFGYTREHFPELDAKVKSFLTLIK